MTGKIKIPESEFLKEKLEKVREEQNLTPHTVSGRKKWTKAYNKERSILGAMEHQEKWGHMTTDTPEERGERKLVRMHVSELEKLRKHLKDFPKEHSAHEEFKKKEKKVQKELDRFTQAKSKTTLEERGMPIGAETIRAGGRFRKTAQGWKYTGKK